MPKRIYKPKEEFNEAQYIKWEIEEHKLDVLDNQDTSKEDVEEEKDEDK